LFRLYDRAHWIIEEIPYLVGQYERAAKNARAADFDGVEIHAANGYLLDQFIQTGTNRRTDTTVTPWRTERDLLFEIAEALTPIWGPDRIGVRISPLGKMNDIPTITRRRPLLYRRAAQRLRLRVFAYGQPGDGSRCRTESSRIRGP